MEIDHDECRLRDLKSLTARQAVDLLDLLWYRKYQELVPTAKKLKQLACSLAGLHVPDSERIAEDESGESSKSKKSDYSALYNKLSVDTASVLKYLTDLTTNVANQFVSDQLEPETENKLLAIYGRYTIIRGDLERYLDRYRNPPAEFEKQYKKSMELYLEAIHVCPQDGKAFSGMYLVASAHQRVLLSFVYLLKSMTVAMPFNENSTVMEAMVARISKSPSDLRDVPIAARACVASCLSLILAHVSGGEDSWKKNDSLLKSIQQTMPMKDVPDTIPNLSPLPGNLPWDTLLVIALMEVMAKQPPLTSPSGALMDVFKMLVGRALSFRRRVTISVSLFFVSSSPALVNVFSAIKTETLVSITRADLSEAMAKSPLGYDHLIGTTDLTSPNSSIDKTFSDADVAAARICAACSVPWGTAPSEAAVANLPHAEGSKTMVIIDAANVACKAGENQREADVNGVVSAYNHWAARGFPVKVFVSAKHAQRDRFKTQRAAEASRTTKSGMIINLDELYSKIPDQNIVSIPAQNHDDSYMILYALHTDGVIVSNDMYRDWSTKTSNPGYACKWASTHLIPYTFVDGLYLPNPQFRMPSPWPNRLTLIG